MEISIQNIITRNPKIVKELGEWLYKKITEVVIPEWTEAFSQITKQDCYNYIYEITLPRTFDNFLTKKSVINDFLAKQFPEVIFEESDPDLDISGDVDYIGKVGNKAFGLQIKPVTANASLGNYDISARMQNSFKDFQDQFGGQVFIIYSVNDNILNKDVYDKIATEIERLKTL